MSYADARTDPRGRLIAISAVAASHLLLLSMIAATSLEMGHASESDALATFDVPPPPPALPALTRKAAPKGQAAPANARSTPAKIVAPPPAIPSPALPAPPVPAQGSAPSAGAAEKPGPGTGGGGVGMGLGSGASGNGAGGGGGESRARLLRGVIRNSDYPRSAKRARSEGTATVQFTVGTDGRATGCRVVQTSGDPTLDSTTCALIERRFIYAPARNAAGETVSELRAWQQRWWLEGKSVD